MTDRPLLIQVLGESGSGKTLVIERCVRRLSARGLAVAVVKHSHHAPDLRGKDSDRFSRAGARLVLFTGSTAFLTFRENPESLVRILPVDVVLIEGYSRRSFGALRFRVRELGGVSPCVRQILHAAPRRSRRPAVTLNGRRVRADRWWWLVLNLMDLRDVRVVRSTR